MLFVIFRRADAWAHTLSDGTYPHGTPRFLPLKTALTGVRVWVPAAHRPFPLAPCGLHGLALDEEVVLVSLLVLCVRLVARRTVLLLKGSSMHRSKRRAAAYRKALTTWHPRASFRRAVTLRVDYVTAQGKVLMGTVRNLSLQGMYIESASRPVTPEVTRGDLMTAAFVLPSGRPCKLRVVVIHCNRQGCGVQFRPEHPQALAPLSHYWASLISGEDGGPDARACDHHP